MQFHPKKLSDQVWVITGATSGIGLATAKMAAKRGVKLMLFARNEKELSRICGEIRSRGGRAEYVVGDVADKDDVLKLADRARRVFGGVDTWVNNAGISIYGKLTEVHLEEKRRLFDVNFWGVVHGCRAAYPIMKDHGGMIINLGSVVSDRAIPLQGIYSAAKHAVRAYTDALRMEFEKDRVPIHVTLVKPAGINTPYPMHAHNHMESQGRLPGPVYDPDVVARALLTCAVKPRRHLIVGGAGVMFALMEQLMPRLGDYFMEAAMFRSQKRQSYDPKQTRDLDNLFGVPSHEGEIRGNHPGHVRKTSFYTSAVLHPAFSLGLAMVAGTAAVLFLGKRAGSGVSVERGPGFEHGMDRTAA